MATKAQSPTTPVVAEDTVFDLSSLGLGSGKYTIKVVATAVDYTSSDFSNEVLYTVAPDTLGEFKLDTSYIRDKGEPPKPTEPVEPTLTSQILGRWKLNDVIDVSQHYQFLINYRSAEQALAPEDYVELNIDNNSLKYLMRWHGELVPPGQPGVTVYQNAQWPDRTHSPYAYMYRYLNIKNIYNEGKTEELLSWLQQNGSKIVDPANRIYFYIGSGEFAGESNMTWEQWVNSSYNHCEFENSGGQIFDRSPNVPNVKFVVQNVSPTDVIKPDRVYQTQPQSSGGHDSGGSN